MNMITVSEPMHDESAAPEIFSVAVPPDGERPEAAPAAGRPARDLFVIAAVALAAFASTLSAVGLAVSSRTVAEAHVAIEQLRTSEARHILVAQAAPAPVLMAAAASAAARESGAPPVTAADVQRMVDSLRGDIARYQTAKDGAPLVATISDGQAELANRLGVINMKLDNLEREISSIRVATSAAGRARPS